ncbi:MAG: hypothetical protein HKO54_09300 [Flavobacteriaceae bacterium]|nr:hypothetical protein [Flavobacteriaceae bacterium]
MSEQNTFFSKRIQEIHAKPNGELTHSSNSIFPLKMSDNLYKLHPFFESLEYEFRNGIGIQSSLAFPCVQLEMNGKEAICDITIKMERGFLAVLLFDYSKHYEHLHEAAQEKKSSMLSEQEHELRLKHLEEKKAYLGFMRARLDNSLIVEMEEMVHKIQLLKKTDLTPEQRELFDDVEKTIGSFHLRAIQIREELNFDFDS